MKITDSLNVEHGVFLNQLRYLSYLVDHNASNQVLAAVAVAIGRAAEFHKTIEEKFLYPEIRKALGGDYDALVALELDHAKIEEALKVLQREKFGRDDVKKFIEEFMNHIYKEVNELFPRAEEKIPLARLEELNVKALEYIRANMDVKVFRG